MCYFKDVTRKQVQTDDDLLAKLERYQSSLPAGTRLAWNGDETCLTFCFPIEGELPGWVAVLRFVNRSSAVELAAFEVTYFAGAQLSEPRAMTRAESLQIAGAAAQWRPTIHDLFQAWVAERGRAVLPVDFPVGGLTVRHLSGVRIRNFQTVARDWMTGVGGEWGAVPKAWSMEATRRSGRAGKDSLHFAQLASRYVALIADGDPKPIESLSAEVHLSASTVRNQIREARDRKLLTSEGQGRSGGHLTPTALQLLDNAAKEAQK